MVIDVGVLTVVSSIYPTTLEHSTADPSWPPRHGCFQVCVRVRFKTHMEIGTEESTGPIWKAHLTSEHV